MRAERIVARGFRNLEDLDLPLPPAGAAFLGPNGHGKTNLLELLYYPVVFRSLRGSRDAELARHGEAGFELALRGTDGDGETVRQSRSLTVEFRAIGPAKRITVDGAESPRISSAIGRWLAVAFLPTDLRLVQGPGAGRRQYLDRMLALADRSYLLALGQYRRALAQRNAALRQQRFDLATAFDGVLARTGAELVRSRLKWIRAGSERFTQECDGLGEAAPMTLRYRGDETLSETEVWSQALRRSARRDQLLGSTTVGPHRHDLELRQETRLLREVGSTGQQRTATVALKLCEVATLTESTGRLPALLLDDVFAELDEERAGRLAQRLTRGGGSVPQTFLTSPRESELPEAFPLERFSVEAGRVRSGDREPVG